MTAIVFIIILSILVLVHEFGHYIAAKRNGIRVEEFGLGLPPKIFGKKVGETVYSINLLPFGGFVKLTGEDEGESNDEGGELRTENETIPGESITIEEVRVEEVDVIQQGREAVLLEESLTETVISTPEVDPKSFFIKTPWQRIKVLAAGVAMNFILAILLFYLFLFINDFKTFQMPLFFNYKFPFGQENIIGTVVVDVQKGSGADKAGVQLGEAVLSINGVAVNNVQNVHDRLVGKVNQLVKVKLLDLRNQANPTTRTVEIVPMLNKGGSPVLGVFLSEAVTVSYNKPLEKIFAGFLQSYNVLSYSLIGLAKIVGISVETRSIEPVSQSVSGPVGIYQLIDSILKYGGKRVWLTVMDYIALMSLSLAFINILPFPALDGGRLFFVVLEVLRGKKVNPRLEASIHKVGMIILLAFIVLITIKDLVL